MRLIAGAHLDFKEMKMFKTTSKAILYAAMAGILCSCASTGGYHSSFSYNGMTTPSTDLRDMHYYMDDDKEMAPVLSSPYYRDNQGSGIYCDSVCRF